MQDDRIYFSHATIWGAQLRRPLSPVIPKPHPGNYMEQAFFAWPLTSEQEPEQIIAHNDLTPADLTPMCRMEFDHILDERTAEVFSRFDLGLSSFKEVPIVKENGDIIPGKWFFFHIGERKKTLVPTKKDDFGRLNRKLNLVDGPVVVAENEIAVTHSALKGVAIWRDPIWRNGIFLHPDLAQALEKENIAEPWCNVKCRYANQEDCAMENVFHDYALTTYENFPPNPYEKST